MFPRHFPQTLAALAIAATVAMPAGAQSVTVKEDFTGTSTTNTWLSFNGACLTAGSGTDQSHLPGCLSDNYYQSQLQWGGANGYLGTGTGGTAPTGASGQSADPTGSGALRLTNGSRLGYSFANGYKQNGAILSNFNFPSNKGIQITFKTVTYGGNAGGNGGSGSVSANDGADGITFFLLDDSVVTKSWNTPLDSGAFGGSLGYTCSNSNNDSTTRSDGSVRGYDGIIGGYIGLGIDEYGNFLNPGDNTASGPGLQANRIGLRGAGSIAWKWLNATYPNAYPSTWSASNQQTAVNNTCRSGYLKDYNGNYITNPTASSPGTSSNQSSGTAVPDYGMIKDSSNNGAYKVLSSSVLIANEATVNNGVETPVKRSQANPITYNLQITQDNKLSLSYSYNGGTWQPVITSVDITNSNGALPANVRFGFAGSDGGSSNIHEILCFAAQPVESSGSSGGVNVYQNPTIRSGTQIFLANYFPSTWTGQMTAQGIGYSSSSGGLVANTTPTWDARCVLTGVDPSTGKCDTTGATSPSAEPWAAGSSVGSSRQILTWDPVAKTGVPFEWSSGSSGGAISTAMQTTIGSQARLNFIRGDRTNEIGNTAGSQTFRTRLSVLADIVDSSPTWVGPPQSYVNMDTWVDSLYPPGSTHAVTAPENSGQKYSAFQSKYTATRDFSATASTGTAGRTNVVYVGGNDGFLHGFRAGSLDFFGNLVTNYTSIPNDGYEVLAYMPGAVFQTIHNTSQAELDYSNPQYSHNWYVDATPGTGDLFYQSSNTSSPNSTGGGSWHTWIVGGLGAGGMGIYALDVTDPSYFTEGNASTLVVGEWATTATTTTSNGTTTTSWTSNLTCAATTTDPAANAASCGAKYLGNTYGTPLIRRFHNGQWGVIFGNGYGSQNGTAGIFIMLVNPSNGSQTFYYLPTGSNATGNGIGPTTSSDVDLDHVIDYIYAGDLKGNLWRFDVTSYDPTQWAVSASSPLFTTPNNQPITTRVVVSSLRTISATYSLTGNVLSTAPVRMMINFGTGQQIPQTLTTATQYATATQTLYGIWDWDMGVAGSGSSGYGWNNLSSAQQAIGLPSSSSPGTLSTSNLVSQSFTTTTTSGGLSYRNVVSNPVCWPSTSFPVAPNNPANPSTCSASANNYGWYMNLSSSTTNGQTTYEQAIFDPLLSSDGMFVINTFIPASNSPLNCTPGTSTGFSMALEPSTGAGAPPLNGASAGGYFLISGSSGSSGGFYADGIGLNGVGTPTIISDRGPQDGDPTSTTYMLTQTNNGIMSSKVNNRAIVSSQRLNWIQRR
jgi:type IV pilus assembly protein PilY1